MGWSLILNGDAHKYRAIGNEKVNEVDVFISVTGDEETRLSLCC